MKAQLCNLKPLETQLHLLVTGDSAPQAQGARKQGLLYLTSGNRSIICTVGCYVLHVQHYVSKTKHSLEHVSSLSMLCTLLYAM